LAEVLIAYGYIRGHGGLMSSAVAVRAAATRA